MRTIHILAGFFLFAAAASAATCTPATFSLSENWSTTLNPVISPSTTPTDPDFNGAVGASAFVDNSGNIYVYYVGYNTSANTEQILMASGTSLSSLTKQGVQLTAGTSGQWDSGYVSGDRVFQDVNCSFYLYYFGSTNATFEGKPASIGVAQSSSITGPWTKYSGNPILAPSSGGVVWDSGTLYRPYMMLIGSTYYLFYNGANGSGERIGYATASSPLGPFTKCNCNPVLSVGSWDNNIVGDPFVTPQGSTWAMAYYGAFNSLGVGLAVSNNLNNWTKLTLSAPLTIAGAGSTNLERAAFANIAGQTYALVDNNNSIFAATVAATPALPPPPPTPIYVQSSSANYAVSATSACVYGANVAAGDLLVVAANSNLATETLSISSDTQNLTWTRQLIEVSDSESALWTAIAKISGAETVTVGSSLATNLFGSICVEYSLVNTLDQAAIGNGSIMTTPTITTTQPTELLVDIFRNNGGTGAISAPFTQRQALTVTGNPYFVLGDNMVTSIGSYSGSSTGSGCGSGQCAQGIASFFLSSSSGQVTPIAVGP
jgi:predicted GH43/DUF377 family glycosyl hydrolase